MDFAKQIKELDVANEPIAEGDYEVVISNMETKQTTSSTAKGSFYINIQFKIRDDVDQKFKNRVIFESIGAEPDQTVYKGWGNQKILVTLLKTQANRDGFTTNFEDGQDSFNQYMIGRPLVITITQEDDQYGGEVRKRAKANPFKWKASKLGEYVKPSKAVGTTNATQTSNVTSIDPSVADLDSSDLPF